MDWDNSQGNGPDLRPIPGWLQVTLWLALMALIAFGWNKLGSEMDLPGPGDDPHPSATQDR